MVTYNFKYIISFLLLILLLLIVGCSPTEPELNACSDISSEWNIQIIARMQPWEVLDWISDEENYIGVSEDALDDYDALDIPDPPWNGCTNCINAYFYHAEWDSIFGDKFTQEYQSNLFCEAKEWKLIIDANSQGPLEVEFLFNNFPNFTENGLNLQFQLYEDGNYLGIFDDTFIIESNLEPNTLKEFLIKVSTTSLN